MLTEHEMLDKAKDICLRAHAGQMDKAGKPYYLHPFAVAERVEGTHAKCVAYLHDVIEDTDVSLSDLSTMGFPADIIAAVEAITRKDAEGYFDFVSRCRNNPLARIVKLADISHNTDPSRADSLPDSLAKRYEKAKSILLAPDKDGERED